jgi:spermidine synthase
MILNVCVESEKTLFILYTGRAIRFDQKAGCMTTIVCLIFFLSGASALIFEVVWFQVCGIAFGNSIWATTIVLSSYMLGLGLGSGLVAFKGRYISFPLRFYAYLEIAIGLVGFFIVLLLPGGTGMLGVLFAHVLDKPVLLNGIRAAISFSIMAICTTAMGATLPVLVKALYAQNKDFGAVLGRLYGFNTIGAVAGVIAADALFIRLFGIKGTGLAACLLSFIAAGTALYLDKVKTTGPQHYERGIRPRIKLPAKAVRLLAASFCTGFSILALEVIWFRFIILFYTPYTWIFCAMLATVLAGIGLGGLLSAHLFKGAADRHASVLPMLFLNAIVIIAGYAFFGQVLPFAKHYSPDLGIFLVTFFLIFPGCFVSGMLFPLIGRLLHDEAGEETTSAGLLTLFNTLGGLAGSLAGVAFFIPVLGMENSVFSIGLFYTCLGLLFLQRLAFQNVKTRGGLFAAVATAGLAVSLAFFPFGRMGKTYLDLSLGTYASMGLKRVAVREGVTETVQCLQKDILDKPYFHVILTNNTPCRAPFSREGGT